MRKEFFKLLYKIMQENENVYALTADLGFGGFDKIQKDFPKRFINCGASEFAMVGIAAGLALEGKIVYVYTITSFYYRAFEMIRTYIDHEKIPVILVGSGRDQEYAHDGYSHNASDIPAHFVLLPNITKFYPDSIYSLETAMDLLKKRPRAAFLSLSKTI